MSAIKPYLKTLSQPSQLYHCHMYQRFSVGQLAKTKLSHKQNCPKVSSMVAHPFGAVGQFVRNHAYRSQMTPQSLLQTLAAYSVRYGLHVHWCGGRAGGEYMAYSLLQKFLAEQEGRLKALIKAHGDAA